MKSNQSKISCKRVKNECHAEFISASTPLIKTQKEEQILNQVQDDNKRGFTLIELLVVVLIIGILAAVALPQYQKAVMKSRFVQAQILTKAIREAEQIYHVATGTYTKDMEELDIQAPDCSLDSNKSKPIQNVYNCAGDTRLTLMIDKDNGNYAVYAHILNSDDTRNLFMEYYFNTPMRLCGANFEVGKQVCQSLGGTYYAGTSNVYYELP